MLDLAVKDGRPARNVATGVNLPRVSKHEHLHLTHEQVEDLAQERGSPSEPSRLATYRLVVLHLACTGVRFGEMAAPKVARLDLRPNRAMIAASVTPIAGQGLAWRTPKSHQHRGVPIPTYLVVELAS